MRIDLGPAALYSKKFQIAPHGSQRGARGPPEAGRIDMSVKPTDPKIVSVAGFLGDVEAQEAVRVNRKGGSWTAIIRKRLAERLGMGSDRFTAATVDLGADRSLLLMGNAEMAGSVRIQRSGRGRVEVFVEGDGDVELDDVDAAFLRLKTSEFERGRLALSGPVSARDWVARAERLFQEARDRHVPEGADEA
jgi:hypothetical protein